MKHGLGNGVTQTATIGVTHIGVCGVTHTIVILIGRTVDKKSEKRGERKQWLMDCVIFKSLMS